MKLNRILLIIFLLLVPFVFAAPGIPEQFYGSVVVNGVEGLSDVIITVKLDNSIVGVTKTIDGKYGYTPQIFYIEDPNGDRYGKILKFYINGKLVSTQTFANGISKELNLYYTGSYCGDGICSDDESSCDKDCFSSASSVSSSGGSSSGGGMSLTYDISDANKSVINISNISDSRDNDIDNNFVNCTPDWFCSEWTECVNSQQKRVCIDKNSCNISIDKPNERQECEMPSDYSLTNDQNQKTFSGSITGLFSMENIKNNKSVISIVIIVLIAVTVIYFLIYHKKQS